MAQPLAPVQPISQFVDPKTGKLTSDGVRFLSGLWTRTGSAPGYDPANIIGMTATGFSFVFNDATSTTSTGPDITFTVTLTNITDPIVFLAGAYDATDTFLGVVPLTGTGSTRTLSSVQFTSQGALNTSYVKVAASAGAFSDTITIVRLNGGEDSFTAYLTNEACTVPSNAAGVVTSFVGASTIIKVFKGATDVTDTFSMSRVDTNLTTTLTGNLTFTPTVTATAMPTVGPATGTATITATNGVVTLTKIFTVGKAIAGPTGGVISAQSNSGVVFRTNSAGTASTPATLTLSRVLGVDVTDTLAAGTVWSVTNGTFTGSLTVVNTTTGAFAAFAPTAMTTNQVTFRCVVTDTVTAIQYFSDITVTKINDNIGGYLTNDSVNVPATTGGVVTNYANATGTFVPTNASGAITITGGNPAFSFVSSTGFSTPPTSADITSSGVYTITTGIDSAAISSTVTWRMTYTSPLGGVFTVDRVFTIGKSIVGATGSSGAPGTNGSGARRAYANYTTNAILSGGPITRNGDPNLSDQWLPLPNSITGGTSFSGGTISGLWSSTVVTPGVGQAMFQSDGVFDPATANTTWGTPYLSNFRVGNLSAISADIGLITAGNYDGTGYIRAQGNTSLTVTDPLGGTSSRTVSVVANSSLGSQIGAIGYSNTAFQPGVSGSNTGTNGIGVFGLGTWGIWGNAVGSGVGVIGQATSSTNSAGVSGVGGGANTVGVQGLTPFSGGGVAVRADATSGGTALQVIGVSTFSGQISSSVATGTAPFSVASTTQVTNLNAALLNGQAGSYYNNAANLTGSVPTASMSTNVYSAIGYVPVQQGTGTSQLGNAVKIGWSAGAVLRLQIDSTDFGATWPINISGSAAAASSATNATNAASLNGSITAGGSVATFSGGTKPGTASTNDWVIANISGVSRTWPVWTV